MEQIEVTVEWDQQNEYSEEGGSDLSDADCTFEEKIEQVIQQLKENRIKVVFDLTSETCNIVPADTVRSNYR
jgi:uncharacterized protein YheU (UPF0270 family)